LSKPLRERFRGGGEIKGEKSFSAIEKKGEATKRGRLCGLEGGGKGDRGGMMSKNTKSARGEAGRKPGGGNSFKTQGEGEFFWGSG